MLCSGGRELFSVRFQPSRQRSAVQAMDAVWALRFAAAALVSPLPPMGPHLPPTSGAALVGEVGLPTRSSRCRKIVKMSVSVPQNIARNFFSVVCKGQCDNYYSLKKKKKKKDNT